MGLTFWDIAVALLPVWAVKVLVFWILVTIILGSLCGLWAWATYLTGREKD